MPRKKTSTSSPAKKRQIKNYTHPEKDRINNPPVGLVDPQTVPDAGNLN